MFSTADHAYMARALRLAARGRYTTQPNPRVGCVLVAAGQVVGEGFHRVAGGRHAEIEALAAAGERAAGATAYVTLEPCAHHGRTPPCAEALIEARVARVVAAVADPNPAVGGRGLAALEAAGIATAMVPGITAASAMAARLGLSLTHRDHAHGVRVVTGHRKDGSVPAISLDRTETTLLYMAGKGAADIARRAIAGGHPSSTPVAAMRSISRPDETRWAGTLAELAAGALPAGDGPVLIGVGAVFASAMARTARKAVAA